MSLGRLPTRVDSVQVDDFSTRDRVRARQEQTKWVAHARLKGSDALSSISIAGDYHAGLSWALHEPVF